MSRPEERKVRSEVCPEVVLGSPEYQVEGKVPSGSPRPGTV